MTCDILLIINTQALCIYRFGIASLENHMERTKPKQMPVFTFKQSLLDIVTLVLHVWPSASLELLVYKFGFAFRRLKMLLARQVVF